MYITDPIIIKNSQLLTHLPCGTPYLQKRWNYLQRLLKIDATLLSKEQQLVLIEERIRAGDFKLYVQVVSQGRFKFDLVHDVIASFFLDLLFLRNNKSMLSLAPRHGKSALMTWLMTFTYALNKGKQNGLYATYGESLTLIFGRQIRDTFLNPVFQNIFPECKLSALSRGALNFSTVEGGSFSGVSVGSSCTGKGAGIMEEEGFPGGLIVDDAVKDMKSALSTTSMDTLKQWYSSEMSTRGNKYHFKLITATRYSLNDLHASLLGDLDPYTGTYENEFDEKFNPAGWRYLNIPALCNDEELDPLNRKLGEAAWEKVFPRSYLINARKEKGEFTFSALYDGNPQPKTGGIFKENYLSWCNLDELPRLSHIYIALDPAFGVLQDESCFTVCGVSAKTDELYILHQRADSGWEFPQLIKEVESIAEEYNPLFMLVENTASGKPLIQHFKHQKNIHISFKPYPQKGTPLKNKQQKVSQVLPLFIDSKVICVRDNTWNQPLLSQVKHFPFGAHDDRLDSLCIGVEHWILNYRRRNKKNVDGEYNPQNKGYNNIPSINDLIENNRYLNADKGLETFNPDSNLTPTYNW